MCCEVPLPPVILVLPLVANCHLRFLFIDENEFPFIGKISIRDVALDDFQVFAFVDLQVLTRNV